MDSRYPLREFIRSEVKQALAWGEYKPFTAYVLSTGASVIIYVRPVTTAGNFTQLGNEDDDKLWRITSLLAFHNDVAARVIDFTSYDGTNIGMLYSESVAASVNIPLYGNAGITEPLIVSKRHMLRIKCNSLGNTKRFDVQGVYQEISDVRNLLNNE